MARLIQLAVISILLLASVNSLPPDKNPSINIIRARRSIDLTSAHSLSAETRLEKTVEPTGYKLELEPYLEDGIFKGRVRINVTFVEETDEIALHCSHDIQVTEVEVKASAGKDSPELSKMQIKRSDMNVKKPIFTIRLAKAVPKMSKGILNLTFNGNMETVNTEALFKTTYINPNEQESVVIGTQLRPNNARRVFPCFDEPAFKTPFQLSVVRPRHMIALSNTPVQRTEEITGEPLSVWDHFEKTPPMSTFTLGLVIADLKIANSTKYTDDNGNKLDIRVWGRQEFLPALHNVSSKVERVLRALAAYWRVPLPLTKLDIVALPNYQGVKPADNWGLIVFKESELGSGGYLQLAQELVYQWLGALATPAWWSDAHLNKALVGYLAAETTFKIDSGVEMEGKWPLTALYSLYYELSKRYPHSRITGMKQETACTKLQLLLRMLNYTLGADTFQRGLQMFMEERKFKNFTGDDIWNALDKAARIDQKIPKDMTIKEVADSWISKDRLPLVTVDRNYNSKTALVYQTLYLRERPHDVPDADKLTWWVPLVLVRADALVFHNATPLAWMRNFKDVNLVDLPSAEHFVIVNPEEIGPFPVNYDRANWNLIATFLQSDKSLMIPELTRAKLLHDAWNLAYAGELSFATALNMTLFLKKERHHVVWDPVFMMFDHIGRHIDTSDVHKKFQTYVRTLLSPLFEELGGMNANPEGEAKEEPWKTNLRSLTKTFLCKAGYKPCIQESQTNFHKWMQAENPDEGNPISNQYICPVFKWGTTEEWEFGLQRVINFPSSRKQSERTYLLKTLAGCPINEEKIYRLLNLTILEANSNFTETDIFLIFSMLTGGSRGYNTLFHFLNNHWDVVKQRFENKTNLWDNLISSATSQFTTQDGLDLVTSLYVSHKGQFGSAEHIVEKSIKNIREEARWSTENLPVIDKWLDSYLTKSALEDDQFIGQDEK